ncbi:MAG TPA: DUF58 domain-containing protein [Sphingomonas sp.]
MLAAVAGAPVVLLVAVFLPGRWYAGLAWPVAVLLLTLADAVIGARRATVSVRAPGSASVGETVEALVTVRLDGPRPPARAEVALAANPIVEPADDGRAAVALDRGAGAVALPLALRRRGSAEIARVWVRWRGPLGLAWHARTLVAAAGFPVLPDIRAVEERGSKIFQRHALQGLLAQVDRGDGSDFDALVEYRVGHDRRAIDWKQSARHLKLHAKEFRTERNAQIVFAVDSGRQMSEPVAGLPRVDRAVSAALLAAWVALKLGDRVALHAFDSRPRIAGGLVSGPGAFPALQRLAARIDYSAEETNHGFALTTLAQRLTRRSMIVLFTEFADAIAADFLHRAARRLVRTHLLLVVVLRDEEIEAALDRPPERVEDVTRAVTAAGLLADRRLALTRLRHLGVHVVESEHDRVGERLVAAYLDLKRRNLL